MDFEIGEVAKRAGVRASAVRYYEKCGLIAPSRGSGGRRVFTQEAVERLVLIGYAKRLGFTLTEIRTLFAGFENDQWSQLAAAKLVEIDALTRKLETMRNGLENIAKCRCEDLNQCAHAIAQKNCGSC